jgi:hypothetical protein
VLGAAELVEETRLEREKLGLPFRGRRAMAPAPARSKPADDSLKKT